MWWRPDSCQLSLSPLYDTSCWAGLGCNQHLQHSVSSISINSLHFTATADPEEDYIYINPQRYSQLVSVTQSGSYAIMHQKVVYLREKKAPNSFTHIGTVDRYLKSDIRYRNGWRGRFSPIRWISIRAGNKPWRSYKFYNYGEGPYLDRLLVESPY